MLKSEMQHQFWITKKTVQRKLGTKEDVHVISSDSELDAKIEIFQSISGTSTALSKLIDQYQEHISALAHEESTFGKFLKEAGKRSKTTGPTITNTGKAFSYSGQQRLNVRVPLLRLQHEVDVFRYRAIRDTQATIQNMEKDRTEYRAALSWMKAASAELDPDTGRGLDKFRTAQSAVRNAKHNFDTSSLDSIQKIDLLAAARCNMFSHALSAYMSELKEFSIRSANTFKTISKILQEKPKYDFTVLKELSQNEGQQLNKLDEPHDAMSDVDRKLVDTTADKEEEKNILPMDKFQTLFFADDFKDQPDESKKTENVTKMNEADVNKDLTEDVKETEDILKLSNENEPNISNIDMLGLTEEEETSICLLTTNENVQNVNEKQENQWWRNKKPAGNAVMSLMESFLSRPQLPTAASTQPTALNQTKSIEKQDQPQQQGKNKSAGKYNAWLEMFAELDPLANPDAFDMKLNGTNKNIQQA